MSGVVLRQDIIRYGTGLHHSFKFLVSAMGAVALTWDKRLSKGAGGRKTYLSKNTPRIRVLDHWRHACRVDDQEIRRLELVVEGAASWEKRRATFQGLGPTKLGGFSVNRLVFQHGEGATHSDCNRGLGEKHCGFIILNNIAKGGK